MDEERGFRDLYAKHAGEVLAFARRRLPAPDAEDLVAEVFLVAWRRPADVPADPFPWLLGVARRVLANRRRGQRRADALVDRLTREARAEGAPELAGELDLELLHALGSLSDADQELLLLVAWEGLDRGQLASVFGVSVGAVAVRLFRARRSFARALANHSERGQTISRSSSALRGGS